MTGILGGQPLAPEDVPQVPAAVVADDFRPRSIGVGMAFHGSGDFVVETRPATMAVELVGRVIERSVALPAEIRTAFLMVGILANKRPLRPFI